jgi:hypothetical protein
LRTTYAAKILLFLKNQEVSFLAVDLLCDPQTLKHTALVSYLIALLDTINKEERSAVLQQLLDEVHFSDEHRREIELFV